MTRPGSLAAAEQLYAEGRHRECVSLANAGLREKDAPAPALLDLKARALDALGRAAEADAARAERAVAIERLRDARDAERAGPAGEADARDRAREEALRAVGARRRGETGPPPETKSDKSGWFLVAAKLGMKTLPVSAKVLTAGLKVGLAAASLGLWALVFNWKFAFAIVLMISVHEWGHVLAMRRHKIPTSGFYLLPFVGGVALAKKRPESHRAWAIIVLAGPAVGATLSLVSVAAWLYWREPWLAGLAIANALLNLLNLLPIYPLDGGQLMKILAGTTSPRGAMAYAVTTGLLSAGALFYGFWLFGLLGLLSVWGLIREARLRRAVAEGHPGLEAWELTPSDLAERGRGIIALAYVGLAAALIALIVVMEAQTGLTGVRGLL